jgi:hypothetical protein
MSNTLERLRHSIATAANDDTSLPDTPERQRHIDRMMAMIDAANEIDRVRKDKQFDDILSVLDPNGTTDV